MIEALGWAFVNEEYPKSKSYWRVFEILTFRKESQEIYLSFTIDPLDGYLQSSTKARKTKQKRVLNTVELTKKIDQPSKESEVLAELSLRKTAKSDISTFMKVIEAI